MESDEAAVHVVVFNQCTDCVQQDSRIQAYADSLQICCARSSKLATASGMQCIIFKAHMVRLAILATQMVCFFATSWSS